MVSFSDIYNRLSDYAKGKVKQLQSLFSKGYGPQQANHVVKLQSGLTPDKQKGVQPHEALQLWRDFRSRSQETISNIPTRRSDWFRSTLATETTFKSPFGYRYLIDVEFNVKNPLTGQTETITNTIGLSRTTRRGVIDDIITARMKDLQDASDEKLEQYIPAGYAIITGSQRITGFFRTVN